ncbi:MAG: ABC-F family ATP-binding cassette domain-containing protein [Bacillota bacterium]
MIILQIKDLTKSYGIQEVFSGLSFTLHEGEKVGLIGPNGTGKSTLLKCLTGEELPDSGEITKNEQTTLGFVAQEGDWQKGSSLFDELLKGFSDTVEDRKTLRLLETQMTKTEGKELETLMHRYAEVTERYERSGGYAVETMVKRIAKGLGFKDEEFAQSVDTMSGGQKTRAALAKVLLKEPDILLLDEPTNHLDISAVEWLEEFLISYPKTVLLVSHDRYFLDKTVTRILDLERGKITSYQETYQGYLQRKGEFEESYLRAYQKQQEIIAKTEEFIRRYKAGVKSKQARGRETILKRMERMERLPERKVIGARILEPVPECGYNVLTIEELSHSFGVKKLFQDINLEITNGEKVALVGDNGTGKSTILKAITGELTPKHGSIRFGPRVVTAYFSQEHEGLDRARSVLEEIMYTFNKGQEEARNLLAAFLLRGDEVEKKIGDLSGGEKSRIALLKLLLKGANFLILDEPTNHLDIPSKEVVEDYLSDYPGTVLVVSHDRYFLDKVADRVVELEDGRLWDYPGNYSYYRFKKKEKLKEKQLLEAQEEKLKTKIKKTDLSRNLQKEQNRALKQLIREIESLEEEIAALETEKEEVALLMSDPDNFRDGEEIKDLINRYQMLEEKIIKNYQDWENNLQAKEELERAISG